MIPFYLHTLVSHIILDRYSSVCSKFVFLNTLVCEYGNSYLITKYEINSVHTSDALMRQWKVSAFVQIMACRLLGTKPVSKHFLSIRPLEKMSVKF